MEDVHLPSTDSPSTPPASLPNLMAPPPAPQNGKRRRVTFMARVLLHALEEISEAILDENREWERSEEGLEEQRKRKLRVLMSMR